MKRITLNVTCKYDVEITRDVSEEVYEQLCDIYDHGKRISDDEIRDDMAMDWLAANVIKEDAINWEYELNDFNEDERQKLSEY